MRSLFEPGQIILSWNGRLLWITRANSKVNFTMDCSYGSQILPHCRHLGQVSGADYCNSSFNKRCENGVSSRVCNYAVKKNDMTVMFA